MKTKDADVNSHRNIKYDFDITYIKQRTKNIMKLSLY